MTGRISQPSEPRRRRRITTSRPALARIAARAGFTLVELMAVLAIVAVLLTLATVNLSFDHSAEEMRREAERLSALLLLARDESIIRSQPLGLRLEADRYVFMVHDGDGWKMLERDHVLRERRLPRRLEMVLEDDWGEAPSSAGVGPIPQVVFTPAGEATPFTITLTEPGTGRETRVSGDGLGRVTVEDTDEA